MTQEDKELLLKDLSARLPYGVKVAFQVGNNIPDVRVFTGKDYDYLKYYHYIDDFTNCTFKPYLRPMFSMTEEEKHELLKFGGLHISESEEVIDVSCLGFERHCEVQDWLNTHHFDYRGLIEKGLALEVTEENNPYKS